MQLRLGTIMRLRTIILLVLAVLAIIAGLVLPAFAGDGDGNDGGNDREIHVYIYHNYYVPYAPDASNCFGAYRLISTRGYNDRGDLALSRTTRMNNEIKTDYVASYRGLSQLYRDDVIVFTDFAVTAGPFEEIEYSGNRYVYHHIKRYYFESPRAFAGYMADLSPTTGSRAYTALGKPYTIALNREVMKNYMPSLSPVDMVPNFPGSSALKDISYRNWTQKPASVGANVWAYTKQMAEVDSKGNPIQTSGNSRSGSFSFRGSRDRYFNYIVALNSKNPSVKDQSGFWSLFSYEILSHIDEYRESGSIDTEQAYDRHSLPVPQEAKQAGQTYPTALLEALKWGKQNIYYSEGAEDTFNYAAPFRGDYPAVAVAPAGGDLIWRYKDVPRQDVIHDTYSEMGERIGNAPKAKKSVPMPYTPGSGALDSLRSTYPGFWHVPKPELWDNTNLTVNINDPEYLGTAPFCRAQAQLYYSGLGGNTYKLGTFGNANNGYEAMADFLKVSRGSIGSGINYLNSFLTRVRQAPFNSRPQVKQSGRSGAQYVDMPWSEPYLPGGKTGGIWQWWYRNDRSFYKTLVPLMSQDSGMALFTAPGATAWNLGVRRMRYPQVHIDRLLNIDESRTYGISTQQEVKARNFAEDSYYQDTAGAMRKNSVSYLKEYRQTPNVDHGNVKLSGSNYRLFSSPLSIRYYPVYINNSASVTKQFPFVGAGKLVDPMQASQSFTKLWRSMPLPGAAAAGLSYEPADWLK